MSCSQVATLIQDGSYLQVLRFRDAFTTPYTRYRHRLAPHSSRPRTRVRTSSCTSVSGSFPVWCHLSFLFGPAEGELGVLQDDPPPQGSFEVPESPILCFIDPSLEQSATPAILSRIPQSGGPYNSCPELKPYPGPCVGSCNVRWRAA